MLNEDTRCTGDNCVLKWDCTRHLPVIPNSDIVFLYVVPPYDLVDGVCTCKCYLEIKQEKSDETNLTC